MGPQRYLAEPGKHRHWAACCHRMQEMWGALALASCGSWHSGVPPSDAGRASVTPQGPLPGLSSRT